MKIIVNGEAMEIASSTLAGLLMELGKGDAKVATSLNEAFVPKALRQTQPLKNGDRVEIVAPRQGG
ncbi:sulfur carrier protein ThiS [Cognatiyoonia sp. IB215446]|uniref:sulfur carrier protein ThiS n=1 Tax=Cognatiyoonia sp. IB215446 TaxID=3097355 RepID=UPI002A0B78FD|nr:sulfur carrier protein ThiS [Cognatiyoonia sp. IB215446]MDX8348607.1 sulfur carrier protein ThiS [Cognatiyoonia sp. IB215446]